METPVLEINRGMGKTAIAEATMAWLSKLSPEDQQAWWMAMAAIAKAREEQDGDN